jgi:predicted signal transduction protein with EAL and GGDEF domain
LWSRRLFKIDRSFVTEVTQSSGSASIIGAVVGIAAELASFCRETPVFVSRQCHFRNKTGVN